MSATPKPASTKPAAPKRRPRNDPSVPSGRAWQRMLSGRRLDLLDPSPLDVEIEDIAQGLSRVARWNGQTHGDWAFSVAQHSLLVERIAGRLEPKLGRHWQLAALLHDAPEYVVGDLITPFKAAVGPGYKQLEGRLMHAVHLRFGLPGELPEKVGALIKKADGIAAYMEATQLAGFTRTEADRIFARPRGKAAAEILTWPLEPVSPPEAKTRFLARFEELA
jgi:5'-deoxynucleotidase YfbR-like HD superfamily hydrolase